MHKLIQGVRQFQTQVFGGKRELFKRLSAGQAPLALLITCSDSRINPNLVTNTEPGELFVHRNVGNIVPRAPAGRAELATVEFAIHGLGIRDIIICGHSDCGAMKGLLNPDILNGRMPGVQEWLKHAEAAVTPDRGQGAERLFETVRRNVLTQIDNLKSHAFVAELVDAGELNIHGWIYKFETGEVLAYDGAKKGFFPLSGTTTSVAMLDQDAAPACCYQQVKE